MFASHVLTLLATFLPVATPAIPQGYDRPSGDTLVHSTVPTPEPATLGLVALGAGGVALASRRRKKQNP